MKNCSKTNKRTADRVASVMYTVALFVLILTVSVALPIYFRPFYYLHVDALELDFLSGYSKAEVFEAYNGLMDYLTMPWEEFSVGKMAFSAEGQAHFADCRVLIVINSILLTVSAVGAAVLKVLSKKGRVKLLGFGRFSCGFWAGAAALAAVLIVGAAVAIDFDTAFEFFHKSFFINQNWVFDWRTDEVILILPWRFFRNCAVLILSSITLLSTVAVTLGVIKRKRSKL